MKRITKVICTLGPACSEEKILNELFKEGMNIARLNMSHGTHESHQELVDKLAPLRKKGLKVLVDLKGPEMRIGTFENGYTNLVVGNTFTFTTKNIIGNDEMVSLRYKNLVNDVKVGSRIYFNNSVTIFEVIKLTKTSIVCKIIAGGKLSNNKSLNVPGVIPSTPYLSEVDKQDILFAIKNKADMLALSFVSNKKNVIDVKNFLKENNAGPMEIIAKIENESGVKKVESIVDECDGIMVARGDLGVEIPLEKIPPVQKKIVSLCNVKKKTCIIATDMLDSMTNSLRPTRAEVNDVATAVYEEATATMLSGETASGIDPVNCLKTMIRIINETEKYVYSIKIK